MESMNTRMPALYIGHGAPPLLDDPVWSSQLVALAGDLPRPKAILIVSAHWESAPVSLSASGPGVGLVYDFGGFAEKYYRMTYETPDATALADRIAAMMPADEPVHQHASRGLDHGAWVPLHLLYPAADIPVVPVSIQPELGPAHQYALGRALAPLREEGVLVIGSGSITHNLHDFAAGYSDQRQAPYVKPFIEWIERKLATGDVDALLDYRRQAPFAERAHPTDEHLLPLFVALGAAGADAHAQRIDAGIDMGFLAMDIYRFAG